MKNLTFNKIVTLTIILLCTLSVYAQYNEYEEIPITRDEMVRRAELKYIKDSNLQTFRYYEDHVVHNYETIDGNVTVVRGGIT